MTRLGGLAADLRTAAAMPRVRVVVSRGDPAEEQMLHDFRRRHPRYRVVGRKSVGAALLDLGDVPDTDAYLAGLRKTRRCARRAEKRGYTVGLFDPGARRDDLLAIHASVPERQGRPIDEHLLEAEHLYETAPNLEYVGVFHDATLVAYCGVEYAGDVAAVARIMGHGDHLRDGVMFLLVTGVVGRVKEGHPATRWLFYDTFFGAGPGLREFKEHLGLRPHLVRWTRERR